MRVTGWEQALVRAIERHAAMPFAWGKSDCGYLAFDCIEAVTGADPFADFRSYTTELGAARKLRRAGFETVEDLFASVLEDTPPTLAQRGDIGVIERGGQLAGCVFTSFGVAVKSDCGVSYEPITAVTRAFKVR
ncbi:DUF6950 family protein [Consotaella aegiceratis]|uniref:DUF6950 family protein n=1 Tax=Consotaella aegiceratis TaxID=3097961 RepID=UPI002F3EE207